MEHIKAIKKFKTEMLNVSRILSHGDLLKLKRWNTPTTYNGWEACTKMNRNACKLNLEEVRDFMPQMGPMIGYAVTVRCEPSNPGHMERDTKKVWREYREYIASIPGPKIVVVEDLDRPAVIGSYWGEVMANAHRALGCVGSITDGAIRDVDEMTNAGFKGLARRLCVGHAYSIPVEWGMEVEVFGTKIVPDELIHADKHGFMVIPEEDQDKILEAAAFMDGNECDHVIGASRSSAGRDLAATIQAMEKADEEFGRAVHKKFSSKGEW